MVSRIYDLAKVLLAACVVAAGGCGGDSPGSPSGGGSSGGDNVTPCATITIANNAVSPKSVTVNAGCQVRFVNNDSRNHEMHSNPHPTHGECPAIDFIGLLSPGQSRQTGNFTERRTCGYHDHGLSEVEGLQGTITIQ